MGFLGAHFVCAGAISESYRFCALCGKHINRTLSAGVLWVLIIVAAVIYVIGHGYVAVGVLAALSDVDVERASCLLEGVFVISAPFKTIHYALNTVVKVLSTWTQRVALYPYEEQERKKKYFKSHLL